MLIFSVVTYKSCQYMWHVPLICPHKYSNNSITQKGRGPGAVVKATCFESSKSRVRTPLWHSCFKETKGFFPVHSYRINFVGSLRDREVASSLSDCQGSNYEYCVWTAVSSHSSHHHQEVLLTRFSL